MTIGLWGLCVAVACGEIIPQDRRIDWQAGVPGGIPNRTVIFCNATNAPYNARGDGVTDNTAAIQNAINACPSNQVVYLPAGNYRVTGQITIPSKSYWTLRGDGPGKTIVSGTANGRSVFYLGQSPYQPAANANILSGFTKGSTNVLLDNLIANGTLIYIDQLNDGSVVDSRGSGGTGAFTDRPRNGTRNVMQIARITSAIGPSITFWPPLNWNYSLTLLPQVAVIGTSVRNAGIEDMTITSPAGTDLQYHVFMDSCDSSWLKNVESPLASHWHLFLYQCLNCEVRDSYVHEAKTYGVNDGYGIEARMCTGLLIENNILWHLYTSMIVTACNGSVIGYNYVYQTYNSDLNYAISAFYGCHGAHPYMNLWEGNVGNEFHTDWYWGSSSHQTLFRNFFSGVDPEVTQNRKGISLDSHSLSNNVVGNILGSSGLSWVYELSTTNYSDRFIYRLGYPGIGNNFITGGTNPSSTDPNAFDARVKSTLLRHGNYDFATKSIVWDPTITDHTLPNSLYLTSKPAWFGNRPWPPFDPAQPLSATATNIPAGYRFTFGTNPPSAPPTIQPPTQLRVTPAANGWTITFAGTPGTNYLVQSTPNVMSSWQTRATVFTDARGNATWTDTNAPTGQGFYRAALP